MAYRRDSTVLGAAVFLVQLVAFLPRTAADSDRPLCAVEAPGRGACAVANEQVLLQRPRLVRSKSLAPDTEPAVAASVPAAPPGSVVEQHGQLQVSGSSIVGARSGLPVRLRGMSLFWSQWKPQFWNEETVQWLKHDWNATLVRAAMAIEHGGYLANPAAERARVEAVVDAAIAAGIYVIIDWHDHNAEQHLEESRAFFGWAAAKYGSYPNVLFEVFNEPVRQPWSTVIKPYHEVLVHEIRRHTGNLVILGTRTWSQDVDEASRDPVAGENLAYTVHFYAKTHGQALREKVAQAVANGTAIFATEWGTCDASGDGLLDFEEAQAWLEFLGRHNISDANWAIGDKREACAALQPGASGLGGWGDCQLTESGAFARAMLRGEPRPGPNATAACPVVPEPPPGACTESGDCTDTGCCENRDLQCYQKNDYWAGCKMSCTPGIDPADPPEHQTPWTCKLLTWTPAA